MNWLRTGAALLAAICTAAHAEPKEAKQDIQCDIGPVSKVFGGNAWLVYSCSRLDTLVFVAEGNNPARPFYFLLYPPKNGSRRLVGEGNGAKSATEPALHEISSLTAEQIGTLIAETRAQPAHTQR